MKAFKIVLLVCVVTTLSSLPQKGYAQCAMCTMNAENSVKNGNTEGKGLNNGILYLLAAPYLAIASVGFVWYKKYRRKNVDLNIKDEKINLN